MTKTSYPLPAETLCQETFVSLPAVSPDGNQVAFTATVDGEMTAAACRWLADRLDEITGKPSFVVMGYWPDYGEEIWDRGLFRTEAEAREAWDAYVQGPDGSILEAEWRGVRRVTFSDC